MLHPLLTPLTTLSTKRTKQLSPLAGLFSEKWNCHSRSFFCCVTSIARVSLNVRRIEMNPMMKRKLSISSSIWTITFFSQIRFVCESSLIENCIVKTCCWLSVFANCYHCFCIALDDFFKNHVGETPPAPPLPLERNRVLLTANDDLLAQTDIFQTTRQVDSVHTEASIFHCCH